MTLEFGRSEEGSEPLILPQSDLDNCMSTAFLQQAEVFQSSQNFCCYILLDSHIRSWNESLTCN